MVNFQFVRDTVRILPFGSATYEATCWVNQYGVDKIPRSNESGLIRYENIRYLAANACLALALPLISTVGLYYNLAAASAHAISAIYAWKNGIEGYGLDVSASVTHIVTAGLDSTVGTVASNYRIVFAIVLILSFSPSL